MLVTCLRCKNPVFVSAAALAGKSAEVACASCQTSMLVSATGAVELVAAAAEPEAADPQAAEPHPPPAPGAEPEVLDPQAAEPAAPEMPATETQAPGALAALSAPLEVPFPLPEPSAPVLGSVAEAAVGRQEADSRDLDASTLASRWPSTAAALDDLDDPVAPSVESPSEHSIDSQESEASEAAPVPSASSDDEGTRQDGAPMLGSALLSVLPEFTGGSADVGRSLWDSSTQLPPPTSPIASAEPAPPDTDDVEEPKGVGAAKPDKDERSVYVLTRAASDHVAVDSLPESPVVSPQMPRFLAHTPEVSEPTRQPVPVQESADLPTPGEAALSADVGSADASEDAAMAGEARQDSWQVDESARLPAHPAPRPENEAWALGPAGHRLVPAPTYGAGKKTQSRRRPLWLWGIIGAAVAVSLLALFWLVGGKEQIVSDEAKLAQPKAGAQVSAASPHPQADGSSPASALVSAADHYRRGNLALKEKKLALAIDELKKCLAADPHYGLAYRSLGVAYMLVGREKSAIAAYEKFVELEPGHRDAPRVRQILEGYRSRQQR